MVRELLAELGALDEDARPKKLLMIRADRLGRGSVVESQIILRDLLALGVGVVTRDQGEVKLDSAMDELISAATLAVARHENEVRSEKMRQVRRRKREAGEAMGKVPYGLRRDRCKDVPDRERARIVREAFKLRLEGKGLHTIGTRLGVIAPPDQFMNGKSRVVHWTPTRVSLLLRNRAYVGQIIDDATFARAQQVGTLLANERKNDNPTFQWPLTGSIRCYCGRAMHGMPCGRWPWRYRYYCCKARWEHDGRIRLVRSELIEKQFVELLGRLRASPKLIEQYRRRVSAPTSPRVLERTITDVKAKLSDVARRRDAAWELHVEGRVRSEDVQERLDRLGSQREELQGRLDAAHEQLAIAKSASTRERDVEALFRRAAQIFHRSSAAEQRQIARAVSIELGGLCVNADGKLKPGRP
jgi:hypothetical protein